MIHLACGLDHLRRGAVGFRIAVGEKQWLVIIAQFIDSQAFGLFPAQLIGGRGDHLFDLLPEGSDHLRGKFRLLRVNIRQLAVTLHTQFFRHAAAHGDHAVIDVIQPVRNALVQRGPGLECLFALGAVHAVHMLEQAVEIAGLPAENGRAGGGQLAVLRAQIGFFHPVFNNGGVLSPGFSLQQAEQLGAEFFFKFRAVGGEQQCLVPVLQHRDQLGGVAVQIFHLRFVKSVGGVDGVAYLRNGLQGGEGAEQLLFFHQAGTGFFIGRSAREFFDKSFGLTADGGDVRALIGKVAEFLHGEIASFILYPERWPGAQAVAVPVVRINPFSPFYTRSPGNTREGQPVD